MAILPWTLSNQKRSKEKKRLNEPRKNKTKTWLLLNRGSSPPSPTCARWESSTLSRPFAIKCKLVIRYSTLWMTRGLLLYHQESNVDGIVEDRLVSIEIWLRIWKTLNTEHKTTWKGCYQIIYTPLSHKPWQDVPISWKKQDPPEKKSFRRCHQYLILQLKQRVSPNVVNRSRRTQGNLQRASSLLGRLLILAQDYVATDQIYHLQQKLNTKEQRAVGLSFQPSTIQFQIKNENDGNCRKVDAQ